MNLSVTVTAKLLYDCTFSVTLVFLPYLQNPVLLLTKTGYTKNNNCV